LVQALGAPVNINVRAGSPDVAELEALGVARASTATALTLTIIDRIRELVRDLRASGRFDAIGPRIGHPEAQALFGLK